MQVAEEIECLGVLEGIFVERFLQGFSHKDLFYGSFRLFSASGLRNFINLNHSIRYVSGGTLFTYLLLDLCYKGVVKVV